MKSNIPENILSLLDDLKQEKDQQRQHDLFTNVLNDLTINSDEYTPEARLSILEDLKTYREQWNQIDWESAQGLAIQEFDTFLDVSKREVQILELFQPIRDLQKYVSETFGKVIEDQKKEVKLAEEALEQGKYGKSEDVLKLEKDLAEANKKLEDLQEISTLDNDYESKIKAIPEKYFNAFEIDHLFKGAINGIDKLSPQEQSKYISSLMNFITLFDKEDLRLIIKNCQPEHLDSLINFTQNIQSQRDKVSLILQVLESEKISLEQVDKLIVVTKDIAFDSYKKDIIEVIISLSLCTQEHLNALIELIKNIKDEYHKRVAILKISISKVCTKEHIDQLIEITKGIERDEFKARAIVNLTESKFCTEEQFKGLIDTARSIQNDQWKAWTLKSAKSKAYTEKNFSQLIEIIRSIEDTYSKAEAIANVISSLSMTKENMYEIGQTLNSLPYDEASEIVRIITESNFCTSDILYNLIEVTSHVKYKSKYETSVFRFEVEKHIGSSEVCTEYHLEKIIYNKNLEHIRGLYMCDSRSVIISPRFNHRHLDRITAYFDLSSDEIYLIERFHPDLLKSKHLDALIETMGGMKSSIDLQRLIEVVSASHACTSDHIDKMIDAVEAIGDYGYKDENYAKSDPIVHIAQSQACTAKHLKDLIEITAGIDSYFGKADIINSIANSNHLTLENIKNIIDVIENIDDNYSKKQTMKNICIPKNMDMVVNIVRGENDPQRKSELKEMVSQYCTPEQRKLLDKPLSFQAMLGDQQMMPKGKSM